MKCSGQNCGGDVNIEAAIELITGCASKAVAYPCVVCGRLHWHHGKPAKNRRGHTAFAEDGKVVIKNDAGRIMHTF